MSCQPAALSRVRFMGKRDQYGFTSRFPDACRPASWRVALRCTLAISLLWGSALTLLSLRSAIADSSKAVRDEDRWKNLGNGVLEDARTKREWLQEDNGDDIDWNSARSYCEGKHHGWRLPR